MTESGNSAFSSALDDCQSMSFTRSILSAWAPSRSVIHCRKRESPSVRSTHTEARRGPSSATVTFTSPVMACGDASTVFLRISQAGQL